MQETYDQLIENLTENAADGVLTAFWDDNHLHLASLEHELREVFDRYLRHATPIRGSLPVATPSTARIKTLADVPAINLGAVDWEAVDREAAQ